MTHRSRRRRQRIVRRLETVFVWLGLLAISWGTVAILAWGIVS